MTTKTFREYYADPEFRRRHLERLTEPVECPNCSTTVGKVNLSRHMKSPVCKRRCVQKNPKIKALNDLKAQINALIETEKNN